MAQINIDVTNETAASGFDPIPAGKYLAKIIEAGTKGTKNNGEMLTLTLEVVEGEFEGRKLWWNINFVHPTSAQAVEIGRKQIKAVCNCVGHGGHLNDTDELLTGQPFWANVVIKKQEGFEPKNEVKSVKPFGDDDPPAQQPAAAKPAAAAPTRPATPPKGNGTAPWRTA